MAEVFISYAREDRAMAERVASGLEAMGLSTFWDSEIPPGQTWADYIEGKLSGCQAVIVLWSQHSTKSQWVREEARMGREKAKLIPALLDASQAPFGFGEVQAADLSNWGGDYNHPAWARFANAVHQTVRGAGAPPPPQPQQAYTPPPQPQQSGWQTQSPPPQAGWSTPGAQAQAGAAENLNPIGYVQKCFRLFANGKGRARRAEYWWFTLFLVIATLIAAAIDYSFGYNPYTGALNSQIVSGVVGLALLAPSVSVMSRRLHDFGQNGWIAGAVFVVATIGQFLTSVGNELGGVLGLISLIALIAIGVIPGAVGANQYGPDPKAV